MRAENLKNMKFGRLTVISRAENTKANRAQWLCICDCGNNKIAQAAYLKKGTTRSCGCLANEQRKKAAQSQCHPYSRTECYRERKRIKYDTLFRRLEAGWSIEKALTEELHYSHHK